MILLAMTLQVAEERRLIPFGVQAPPDAPQLPYLRGYFVMQSVALCFHAALHVAEQ
jgi:hypothetical protein